jgi:putative ABC transport system permease protein
MTAAGRTAVREQKSRSITGGDAVQTIDISYTSMAFLYGLIAIPVAVGLFFKLGTVKRILIGVLRMTVQMAVLGLYLDYLFKLNNIFVNFAWVMLILTVANITVQRNSGLKTLRLFFSVFLGTSIATFFVISIFIFLAIRPEPFYDARYVIPITGMVVGNCMRANVIALERFYNSIRKNEKEFLTYLLLGASLREAALPYMGEAIRPAMAPNLATMTTLGLVSLPGMMTGQILGGSPPIVAIKYQIAIMLSIFTAITIATSLNLLFSLKIGFNEYDMLRKDMFR